MSKINIIPIFVPHLGCPNDCVFCNQRRITGIEEFSKTDFIKKLNYFVNLFRNSKDDVELAFYGGSFTAIDKELQFDLLEVAKGEKEKGNIQRIRISTRPDAIDPEVLEYLTNFSVDIIELGVQSLDEEILEFSKRGHSKESVYNAVKLIREYNFKLGLQQMIGLPRDTFSKSLETTLGIISLNPDFVRIYPTLVIKNTELELLYNSGKYSPLSLNEAVNIVTKLMLLFEYYGINIARVGLQSTPELQFEREVVSGPLHDAFRELCESEKLYKIILGSNCKINKPKKITSSPRNTSLLVGQKGMNKERLKKLYGVSNLSFYSDKKIDEDKIIIENDESKWIIGIKEESRKIVEGWEYVFKKH